MIEFFGGQIFAEPMDVLAVFVAMLFIAYLITNLLNKKGEDGMRKNRNEKESEDTEETQRHLEEPTTEEEATEGEATEEEPTEEEATEEETEDTSSDEEIEDKIMGLVDDIEEMDIDKAEEIGEILRSDKYGYDEILDYYLKCKMIELMKNR
jgi:flagellar biosynthesis/type III secretory pathway M-ring protein FliF/YscJ